MSLKDILECYSKSNMYPFHMPGHKRMLDGCYKIDMTEVEGVDDLHDPQDVIAKEQERMAKHFGAKKSFILVGGSTVGNLAGIYGVCNEGDTILIQRNSHKSVYNATMLRHLHVEYLESSIDENGIFQAITLEKIKQKLEDNRKISAVVLTSPSYEGYHCKIEDIAKVCHEKNVILIVDQAHGAHLGFHEAFTNSAVKYADIIIQSLHKTLPCLTQTAALHISGDRVNVNKIKEAIDIYETSSPSYVLMNSVSECLNFLEENGDLFGKYVDNLTCFYEKCGNLKNLKIITKRIETKDPGKIIISTKDTNITGIELAKILRTKYEIETEMASFSYVLAMTSVMDSKEGFSRLEHALKIIDAEIESGKIAVPNLLIDYVKKMEIFEAKAGNEILLELKEAKGKISSSMVCLYPPGSPLLVPGELITEEIIDVIMKSKTTGIHVTGLEGGRVSVVN